MSKRKHCPADTSDNAVARMKYHGDTQAPLPPPPEDTAVGPHSPPVTTSSVEDEVPLRERFMYSKAGEAKVLKKKEVFLMTRAKLLQCDLQLSHIAPVQPCSSFDVKGRITVTLSHGDLSQHTAEALVCPLGDMSKDNRRLAFDNPLALRFLQSGGPEIERAVGRFRGKKSNPRDLEIFLSDPGTLGCKKLIYVVMPSWLNGVSNHQTAYLQSIVHESLVQAERNQCASIGMSALGYATLGLPMKGCVEVIMRAICSFLDTGHGVLRSVHLVESTAQDVGELKSAIEGLRFSQSIISQIPSSNLPPESAPSPPPTKDPNSQVIGGVLVTLKKGDITKVAVDVIVNSTNRSLDLNSGVSGAILKAAGNSVVDECSQHGFQPADGVVLTSGGSLSCKHIAHMVGPNQITDITNSIEKVFLLCESKMATTVAIPTVGTGRGGISPHDCIEAVLMAVENHTSQVASSSLRAISVVAFEDQIFNTMRAAFVSTDAESDSSLNEVEIHGVTLKVRRGNITNERAKAIVNSSNANLDFRGGVSGAILGAAGAAVQQQCINAPPLTDNQILVTGGGDLPCDHILHMEGPRNAAEAVARVRQALQCCESKGINTLSLPAVGTGAAGMSGSDCVDAILQALAEHLASVGSAGSSALKLLSVVIWQDAILQDFLEGLDQWRSDQRARTAVDEEEEELDVEAAVVSFPTMVAVVTGHSAANVAQVKQIMDDMIAVECHSEEHPSDQLPLLLKAEKRAVLELSRASEVGVLTSPSSRDRRVTISGQRDDVRLVVQLLRMSVRWDAAAGDSWRPLPPSESMELERALCNEQTTVTYSHGSQTYTADLKSMRLTNAVGTITRIKRAVKGADCMHHPPTWTQMDDKDVDIVDVDPNSDEYKSVWAEFLATSNKADILKAVNIHRIQHKLLWPQYVFRKQLLDKKYPTNELNLYHGTTSANCQKINVGGFNRSSPGKNGTYYGHGTYFAKQSWYSAQRMYSSPDADGVQHVYRARVLVGRPCVGTRGMWEPLPLNPHNLAEGLHDCAVDNLHNPSIYVVFCDASAYPDYLITFKVSDNSGV